jgi:hypothetical protein
VKDLVELEEVVFTGGPAYDENGTMYVPNPSKIDYIGDPSPKIDDAWNELIEGMSIQCRFWTIANEELNTF